MQKDWLENIFSKSGSQPLLTNLFVPGIDTKVGGILGNIF
jgi:hypothetical protein